MKKLIRVEEKDFLKEELDISYVQTELIPSIDFKELNDRLRKASGYMVSIGITRVKPFRGEFIIDASSGKIVGNALGIFKAAVSEASIETFNTSLGEEKGSPVWWATWAIRYKSGSGGTNGITFLTSWYNFDTRTWTFRED